jgi:hypothetical protein
LLGAGTKEAWIAKWDQPGSDFKKVVGKTPGCIPTGNTIDADCLVEIVVRLAELSPVETPSPKAWRHNIQRGRSRSAAKRKRSCSCPRSLSTKKPCMEEIEQNIVQISNAFAKSLLQLLRKFANERDGADGDSSDSDEN